MRPKSRGAHFPCSRVVVVVIILLCKVQGFFAIGRRFDKSPPRKRKRPWLDKVDVNQQ